MPMKMIPTYVDEKTAEKFGSIARREGRAQSDMIREMIESFCDDTGIQDAHVNK